MLPLAVALCWAVPALAQDTADDDPTSLDRVFARMYNVDFAAAHDLLDARAEAHPEDPLNYSVRAVAEFYAEMQRLNILETEFFLDDEKVTSAEGLEPDPLVRARIVSAVDEARRLAAVRLATVPDDPDALFATCMAANVMTDYTGLVEQRQLRGLSMAREVHACAGRLINLTPPVYDAYHAMGVIEYINSKVPFYVRWFVRFKDVEGSEARALEYLQVVVDRGRYYGPFAKVLIAILHLRDGRTDEARTILTELAKQFPDNPLFPKELERLRKR